mgnify:CR=1 FL=1
MEFEWLNSKIAEDCIEVVLVFDEQGTILYGNKSAMDKLEYSQEELLACNMTQIFKQEFQTTDCAFQKNKIFEKKETALYRKNSSCFYASIRCFSMENGLFYLLAEDITAQKDIDIRIRQMKEAQENEGRARTEFTANITAVGDMILTSQTPRHMTRHTLTAEIFFRIFQSSSTSCSMIICAVPASWSPWRPNSATAPPSPARV